MNFHLLFGIISGDIWQKVVKIGKILRGVTQLNFDKKSKLNVGKKTKLSVERKKKKRKV
jgi:hypothetical protein